MIKVNNYSLHIAFFYCRQFQLLFDKQLPTVMEASPFLTILSLPPELILGIADHLPPDALISLKLAHSKFYNTLPAGPRLKRSSLTPCARLAIRTYLESPTPNPSHIRCVLCKALYPPSLFNSSSSPACVPLPDATAKTRQEVVELPERFCAWHVGRLTRVVHVKFGARNEWVSRLERMCMHCGSIKGWRVCMCECQSCGTREVRAYTRYLDNKRECRTFAFWRRDEGNGKERTLLVRETCWDNDNAGNTSVINLLVHFEAQRLQASSS